MRWQDTRNRACLRRTPESRVVLDRENDIQHETQHEEPAEDEKLLCRQCGNPITSLREQISVSGSHQHTFANPAGILFEIGCFRSAFGCVSKGPATFAWSWFSGYSWRIVLCGVCLSHLGWFYTGEGKESFYGLILNRLTRAC